MKPIEQGYIRARGTRDKYDSEKYKDIIYFATDTQEILLNGVVYGSSDASVGDLKLIVESHTEALQVINGTGEGSLQNILQLSKEYTDSKLVDVSELKLVVDKNTEDLSILKGDVNQNGSILNIVSTAFQWDEI